MVRNRPPTTRESALPMPIESLLHPLSVHEGLLQGCKGHES